jgi:putative ABC transport system substrate-binding protein
MRRREFISVLGCAAAWPLAARGQRTQPMKKLAILADGNEASNRAGIAIFRQGLERAGWSEGRNLQSTIRWGDGRPDRIRTLAAEVVKTNPDLILVLGETGLSALLSETRSIPVVFSHGDAITTGLVADMARPAGNATGFTTYHGALIATKWLQMLKEFVPGMSHLLVLSPGNPTATGFLKALESVIGSFAVAITPATFAEVADIDRAIEKVAREPQAAMIVLPGSLTNVHRDLIIALAARHQLPAIYAAREFVVAGGLLSYAADRSDPLRLAAGYVDRILKGEKPGDLPVQAPTKYELVINLKTATALGLTVPPTLLALADEIIE